MKAKAPKRRRKPNNVRQREKENVEKSKGIKSTTTGQLDRGSQGVHREFTGSSKGVQVPGYSGASHSPTTEPYLREYSVRWHHWSIHF
jgi:hypothetical protein